MKLGLNNTLKNRVAEGDWSPDKVSSLIHWYKYDTGITADGENNISLWADQEGGNKLLASGGEEDSPSYDHGAVKFADNDDNLEWGNPLSLGTFSIYMRFETSDVDVDWIMKGGSTDWIKLHDDTNFRVKILTRMDFDISGISANTKVNLGVDRASNGDVGVFINNSAQSVASGYTDNVAISTTLDLTKVGSPLQTVKIYEILIFNDVLSSGDKNSLNTYLNTI